MLSVCKILPTEKLAFELNGNLDLKLIDSIS